MLFMIVLINSIYEIYEYEFKQIVGEKIINLPYNKEIWFDNSSHFVIHV